MRHTRIKFCGMTRQEDVKFAASLGVDALGFVFCPQSPRALSVEKARSLIEVCPPFITRVGLFMNQEAGTIRDVLEQVSLDLLQFHGEESESFCMSFGQTYIKSLAMGGDDIRTSHLYKSAAAILLDSNELGQPGGSGNLFDWQTIPANIDKPIILAGGLNVANVAHAINQVKPYAVDVSTGIEISKGMKDKNKMTEFVNSVRATYEC